MRLYRFWADARASEDSSDPHRETRCYAGSNESRADAERKARTRATQLAEMIRHDLRPEYGYADRPLREEIIDEIASGPRGLQIAITRNAYGALILNCASAFFADIDAEEPKKGLIASMFGRKTANPETVVRERVRAFADAHRLGVRLYRTAAGFRALVTTEVFDPVAPETAALLRELRSDPRYIQLCGIQESFRARLTPKPWRCGLERPADRFPRRDAEAEARFQAWERQYDDRAAGFATCRLLDSFGPDRAHAAVAPVVAAHDDLACAPDLPLA